MLEGRLAEGRMAVLEDHLDGCASCRALVARAARMDSTPPGGAERDEPVGERTIGRYRIVGFISAGGMGSVYAARDPDLDRPVALKVLRPELAAHTEWRLRLLREGKVLAALSHPNVVAVYDVGTTEEGVFIAMELVDGVTLEDWLREGRRPWREVLRVFIAAGEGLAAAHAAGIVHRDFKPANVLLGKDGRVRVTDFGLARPVMMRQEGGRAPPRIAGSWCILSGMRQRVGTPRYMAPEQHRNEEADERTDQFSFCVALYEGLYGDRPFAGETAAEIASSVCRGALRRPSRMTGVPRRLFRALSRGLARDPADRYPALEPLLVRLRAEVAGGRQRRLALAGAAVAALSLALVARRDDPARPCTGAVRQLDGVWDPTRRTAVQNALLATGVPYAARTWAAVAAKLDRYAGAWIDAYREACVATRLRGEQSAADMDLRMRCLQGRRIALRVLGDELAHADGAIAQQALPMVESLPGLDACAHPGALSARAAEPDDPAVRAKLDEVRALVERARLQWEAFRYRAGIALAKSAVAQARAVQHRPIEAEALYVLGYLSFWEGAAAEGATYLDQAAAMALGAGDLALAAAAWAELTAIAGHEAREAEARRWASYAEAAVRPLGGDPVIETRVAVALGVMLSEASRHDEARARLARAYALRKEHLGPDHWLTTHALAALGHAAARRGDHGEAEHLLKECLAARERTLGPDHPSVAVALSDLGSLSLNQGRPEVAHGYLERALRIQERALGRTHRSVALTLANQGNALTALGRLEEALALHRRALEIRSAVLDAGHFEIAESHRSLALIFRRTGRLSEAATAARLALALDEKRYGPSHPRVAESLRVLAEVLRAAGDAGAARPLAARAHAIAVSPSPADAAAGHLVEGARSARGGR